MRMRKKKHREERIENCKELLTGEFETFRYDFKSLFENKENEVHIVGCGYDSKKKVVFFTLK